MNESVPIQYPGLLICKRHFTTQNANQSMTFMISWIGGGPHIKKSNPKHSEFMGYAHCPNVRVWRCRFGQQRVILSSSDHNGHPNVNACIINIVVLVVLVVCSVIRVLNNEKYYSSKNLHHIPPRPKMKQGVFRIWQPFLKGSDKHK